MVLPLQGHRHGNREGACQGAGRRAGPGSGRPGPCLGPCMCGGSSCLFCPWRMKPPIVLAGAVFPKVCHEKKASAGKPIPRADESRVGAGGEMLGSQGNKPMPERPLCSHARLSRLWAWQEHASTVQFWNVLFNTCHGPDPTQYHSAGPLKVNVSLPPLASKGAGLEALCGERSRRESLLPGAISAAQGMPA